MASILNKGQQECLEKLIEWWKTYDGSKQVFSISGLAGCGKTFVIRYLIDMLDDINLEQVLFVAYIGKAAMQMTKSGVRAKTIHSAIYVAVDVDKKDENGKPIIHEGRKVQEVKFIKRESLPDNIKLIVVDEAPMVDERVGKDLLSFGLPVIALGDLNQLPPVIGKSFFLKNPDHTLTEIMRQKSGSPILKLAEYIIKSPVLDIRHGSFGNELLIINKKNFMTYNEKALLSADTVICGKNSTRDELNLMIRDMHFKSLGKENPKELEIGDKLICRKNNWMRECDNVNLINGLVGNVTGINYEIKEPNCVAIDFKPDFLKDTFENVMLNLPYFTGNRLLKERIKSSPHDGDLFEYGYAITCHLAQGSQYEKVIVFAERLGDLSLYRKWLYTAVTRASSKLILII